MADIGESGRKGSHYENVSSVAVIDRTCVSYSSRVEFALLLEF